MSFEHYTKITDNADKYIKPQKSESIYFEGCDLLNADRLFFTGESNMSYFWKSEPDHVFSIDIDEGTYDYKDYFKDITFDAKNTANVCYYIEGEDYAGKIYFEQPLFCDTKMRNIMPQFAPHSACAGRRYSNLCSLQKWQ